MLANRTSTMTSRAARATNADSGRVVVGYWSCANASSMAAATASSLDGSSTSTLNWVTMPPVPPRCAVSCKNPKCAYATLRSCASSLSKTPATQLRTPAASKRSPARKRRRSASAAPINTASPRDCQSLMEPERSCACAMCSCKYPSSGTPRKVTTSSEARQLLTTILMGTADFTPSMLRIERW